MAFPSTGGFGGNPAPAPSFGAPATNNAPAPFSLGASTTNTSFGTTNNNNTTPAPAAGSFSFNATSNAPAPTGGFSFSTTTTSNAPAAGNTASTSTTLGFGAPAPSNTPAPATGFGTGTTTPGTLSFGNTAAAPSTTPALGSFAGTPGNPSSTGHPFPVPNYEDVFPGHVLWKQIRPLAEKARNGDSLAGQELKQILSPADPKSSGSLLLHLANVWKWQNTPAATLNNLLQLNNGILLWGKEVSFDQNRRERVLQIASELRLAEGDALALYAHTERQRPGADLATAREVYFEERSFFLKTLLFLIQNRQLADDGSLYMQATDALLQKGLVSNLLRYIQEITKRLSEFREHITTGGATTVDHRQQTMRSHWNFGMEERRRAAECVFFIAYHTQMEVPEITALIDTVHFLANPGPNHMGMPDLDPFDHAPSAYEESDPTSSQAPYGFLPAAAVVVHPPTKEKDPSVWRAELVEECLLSGQTYLLRCVSILLVAGITAFDTKLEFVDRNTHAINSFGRGNALIPRDDASGTLNHLSPLEQKLSKTAGETWKRQDVFGIILSAYGLLLKAAPSALTSPRGGTTASLSGGVWSPQEIRRRRSEALDFPTQWRSFTFGRLSLVPAVAVHADPGSYQICDTESFALDILCGFMARYLEAIAVSPPVSREKWLLDAQDDLRLRQQDEAQKLEFQQWAGTTNTPTEHVPKSVDILERPDCMDDVVAFCMAVGFKGPSNAFWDFDSALYPSRAMYRMDKMINDDLTLRAPYFGFLTMLATTVGQQDSEHMEGAEKLHSLLSNEAATPDSIQTTWFDIMGIIRHYARYLVDKDSLQTSTQSSTTAGRQSTVYYYFNDDDINSRTTQSTKKSSSSSKPRLDTDGAYLLSACLSLLEAVASRSSAARTYLRNLSLPVESSDGILGRDSTLLVLFTLATAPIAPKIRGLVFTTIAAILDDCSQEEALNAWNIVESSGFLPIYKLQQYPTEIGENEVPRISFPTSLTAQVREKPGIPIPADQKFSIMFEMEYIESIEASYPSTSGFMILLTSLIKNGGCPSNLGHSWRARTGCAPYIEYAMDFVLPRALGTFGSYPGLSFQSSAEKNRLYASTLGLIRTVGALYVFPHETRRETGLSLAKCLTYSKTHASQLLSLADVADSVVTAPSEQDFTSSVQDFLHGASASGGFQGTALPAPKTPGFTVLFRAFQNDPKSLCSTLVAILSSGDVQYASVDADEYQLSLALFGRLRPSFANSKSGKPQQVSKLTKLLVGLEVEGAAGRATPPEHRHNVLSNILQLFCILVSREEAFHGAVTRAGIGQMVPSLRFDTKPGPPDIWVLNFSGIGPNMETFEFIESIISCVCQFEEKLVVPSFATVLLFLTKDLPNIVRYQKEASTALADLFSYLANMSPLSTKAAGLFAFALVGLLAELRKQQPARLVASMPVQPLLDSLTAAVSCLDMLEEKSAKVASLCFEMIVLLQRTQSTPVSTKSFYFESLANMKYFVLHAASGQAPRDILNSTGWVLTGIAEHLIRSSSVSIAGVFSHVSESHDTIREIFEGRELEFLFQALPNDTTGHTATLSHGLHLCLGACVLAASRAGYAIPLGDVVSTLLKKLCENQDETTLRNLALCLYIAMDHTEVPGSAVLDVASAICDAIVNAPASRALLVAALISTLSNMEVSDGDQSDDMINDMLHRVSQTLVMMSCQVSDSFPPAPTSEALASRTALKLLFSSASEGAIQRVLLSSSHFTAKRTCLDELVSLTAGLDQDISNLLSMVGRFPFGGKLLFRSGILGALQKAAYGFHNWLESNRQQFPSASTSPPEFLFDHFQLMNCVLVNGVNDVTEGARRDAAIQALEILTIYDPIISHLLGNFPSDKDLTAEYFRCLAIVQSILGHVSHYPSPQSELRVKIPQFVFQLLEHPVPKACRGPIPAQLMRSQEQPVYGVTRTDPNEKGWWEVLRDQSTTPLGHDGICFFGKQAADIALAGLKFVAETDTIPSIDAVTVGRSLIASADSVLVSESVASYLCAGTFLSVANESPSISSISTDMPLRVQVPARMLHYSETDSSRSLWSCCVLLSVHWTRAAEQ